MLGSYGNNLPSIADVILKMVGGKMVPWKKNLRKNGPGRSLRKMVLRKEVPWDINPHEERSPEKWSLEMVFHGDLYSE